MLHFLPAYLTELLPTAQARQRTETSWCSWVSPCQRSMLQRNLGAVIQAPAGTHLLFPARAIPITEHLKADRASSNPQMDRFFRPEAAPQGCANRTLPLEDVPMANIISKTANGRRLFSTLLTAREVAGSHRCPRESWTVHGCLLGGPDASPPCLPATVQTPGAEPTPAGLASSISIVSSGAYSPQRSGGSAQLGEPGGGHDPDPFAPSPLKSRTPSALRRHCSVTTASAVINRVMLPG